MDKEAIEEAIEVLEDASAEMLMETGEENYYGEAIAILRQALSREAMKHIKTWSERCEEHPDHQERIITERMIQERMQEEIDELRQALETKREWVGLTDEEIVAATNAVHGFGAIKQKDMNFAKAIEARLREKNA